MKYAFHLAVIGVCSICISCIPRILAQNSAIEKPRNEIGTKIAVVNINVVLEKYWRAINFKRDLEDKTAPYKEKAKKLRDELATLLDELRKPGLPSGNKIECEQMIEKNKADVEQLGIELTRLIRARQDENTVLLWKDITTVIEATARAYGFQIVLSYGEPGPSEQMFQSIKRDRKYAVANGDIAPLYIHGSVDITNLVIELLEPRCANKMRKVEKADDATVAPK